jgi:hypothetical protein
LGRPREAEATAAITNFLTYYLLCIDWFSTMKTGEGTITPALVEELRNDGATTSADILEKQRLAAEKGDPTLLRGIKSLCRSLTYGLVMLEFIAARHSTGYAPTSNEDLEMLEGGAQAAVLSFMAGATLQTVASLVSHCVTGSSEGKSHSDRNKREALHQVSSMCAAAVEMLGRFFIGLGTGKGTTYLEGLPLSISGAASASLILDLMPMLCAPGDHEGEAQPQGQVADPCWSPRDYLWNIAHPVIAIAEQFSRRRPTPEQTQEIVGAIRRIGEAAARTGDVDRALDDVRIKIGDLQKMPFLEDIPMADLHSIGTTGLEQPGTDSLDERMFRSRRTEDTKDSRHSVQREKLQRISVDDAVYLPENTQVWIAVGPGQPLQAALKLPAQSGLAEFESQKGRFQLGPSMEVYREK